ncbi:GNAT family N-acetyltransferase [Wukongibacter baidiensis]|uniref:GNAT family N-acetyltransferase n=1 Tax=Wukongibacter baidiensis TaxID=1723361 RepID=UPI003D7FEE69
MKVYSITEKELNKFASFSQDSTNFGKTVKSLWDDGLSLPKWCFIMEEEGKTVGRIGYWAPSDNKKNIYIFGLLLPWERNNAQLIGQELLNKSLQVMKMQGAKSVDCQVHSDDDNSFFMSKKIYEAIGMEQIQSKKSFIISDRLYEFKNENRLFYKSLREVGARLFIKTIQEVTKATLDQEDKLSALNLGVEEAAKDYFSILKSIDYSIDNWYIGYRNNKCIGLIIPQKLKDNVGAINYIGVIPEERGNGYVVDLLNKGIKNLFSRDIGKVIADIDELNFPMENALLKAGFKEKKKILVYRLTL